MAYLGVRRSQSFTRRVIIVSTGAMLIALIGFSRIYLGFHFLSDVLAGYLVGASWLIMGIIWVESKHKMPDSQTKAHL